MNKYQESSVSIQNRLQAGQLRNQSWIPSGARNFSLLYKNQLALGPTQHHIQWVKGPVFLACNRPPTCNLVQRLTTCGATPLPPTYYSQVWCSIKHKDTFTLLCHYKYHVNVYTITHPSYKQHTVSSKFIQ